MKALPQQKRNPFTTAQVQMRVSLCVVIAAILFDGVASAIGISLHHENAAIHEPSQQEIAQAAPAITSGDLLESYLESETRADRLYRGKMLRIAGTIAATQRDDMDRWYVAFATGDENRSVVCILLPTTGDTSKLRRNNNVMIAGICDGFAGNVRIKDAFMVSGP